DAQHLLPLVGRDRELATLLAECDRAFGRGASSSDTVARSGRVVWLTGPSGAGKSRLLNELAARVRATAEPPLYLYGRCRQLDDVGWAGEDTLSVLVQIVERIAGTRILLVLGERTDAVARAPAELAQLRERLAQHGYAGTLALEPLEEDAVQELVRALFHHSVP